MKKLSTYLFLVLFSFSVPSFADDISDFQIEGMSVGDSLLDYFSEKEIKKNKKDYYTDDKFTPVDFVEVSFFTIYDGAQIHYKTKGKKYIIYSLDAVINFENNISECYKKQNEITEELSNIFISTKKTKRKKKHRADKSGKSTVTSVFFKFKSGDYVSVECLDWSKKMRFRDHLRVSITLKELSDWLSTENIYK